MGKQKRGHVSQAFVESVREARAARARAELEGQSGRFWSQSGQVLQAYEGQQSGQVLKAEVLEGQQSRQVLQACEQEDAEEQSEPWVDPCTYGWSGSYQRALQDAIDSGRIPPLPTTPLQKPWLRPGEAPPKKWSPADEGGRLQGEYQYKLNAEGQPVEIHNLENGRHLNPQTGECWLMDGDDKKFVNPDGTLVDKPERETAKRGLQGILFDC